MEPTLIITVNGEDFPLADPTVQEVRQVKRWTGFASRPAWFTALIGQDGDALLAAYVIAKRRKGEPAEYDDNTDFPAQPTSRFVDGEGREVEPALELNTDNTVKTTPSGAVIPILDADGAQQWRDVETGAVIPFEKPATTTADSGKTPTPAGDIEPGTPRIAAV